MPINGVQASAGKKPATPTIGTATDGGTGTTVSVAFTPSSYIGKGTITYTATSNPGSITATGSGSPITVSSLTAGTAYTFTVKGDTNYGVASDSSAASNSVTPVSPTAFDSIATATGTGSSNTITFSNIPQTYKSLHIRFIGKSTSSTINPENEALRIRFNNSSVDYSAHYITGQNSSIFPGAFTSSDSIHSGFGVVPTSKAAYPNMHGVALIDIIDYTSTTKNKTLRGIYGFDVNNATYSDIGLWSGLWYSTPAAITSITLFISNSFTTTTQIALYGVK